jgi:hypothetical protein
MMQRRLLQLLFVAILVAMIAVTTWASLKVSLWGAWPDYVENPWAIATLFDAYFGFVTFYVWVAWRERAVVSRVAWFVLIMCLGNIAMAIYVLLQLSALGVDQPASSILGRKAA